MEDFETLLETVYPAVERYIKFRVSGPDGEDLLQEVCLTAYRKFGQLKDPAAFKSWILTIARNKCHDYFRAPGPDTVPLETIPERKLVYTRQGISVVEETMEMLKPADRQILELVYWQELPQAEISRLLGIPVGTVKSRLHGARGRFRERYPYPPQTKGDQNMKKLPKYMPDYAIRESVQPPFAIKWEELMGYFMVPRLGEKLSWGIYDQPSKLCSDIYKMEAVGKARVHGIEGVEITVRAGDWSGKDDGIKRVFVAQLTDTHCRYLAALRTEGDVRNYITFLDSDIFMPTWGFGDNNCGHEINLVPRGDIVRQGNVVKSADKKFLLDIVGRYEITINGKTYDTVCLMDLETKDTNVFSEQYIDRNGRTILWRRFNRDDWSFDPVDKRKWSEKLPDNERITVNGQTYVHWYDCISDYIL